VLPGRKLSLLVLSLFVSAAYLYAFPQANLIYPAVVLLHAFGACWPSYSCSRGCCGTSVSNRGLRGWLWLVLLAGAFQELILLKLGHGIPITKWLYWHMACRYSRARCCSVFGFAAGMAGDWSSAGSPLGLRLVWCAGRIECAGELLPACAVEAAGRGFRILTCRLRRWTKKVTGFRVHSFQVSAQVAGRGKIPSKYFMDPSLRALPATCAELGKNGPETPSPSSSIVAVGM